MRFLVAGIVCVMMVACLTQAHAAWLQTRGTALIISSLINYSSDARFDAFGQRVSGVRYRKQEASIYSVYGVSNSVTLGAQPSFYSLGGAGRNKTLGLSYIELFARTKVWVGDFWIVSAQALVKFPGANSFDREPFIEAASRDMEGRILFGRNGSLLPHKLDLRYFTSIEAGFRRRDGNASDQLRADTTFGLNLSQDYQMILQSFNIAALGGKQVKPATDYDLYKAQISVVRKLPRAMSVQFGGFTEFAGRNTGAGNALFLAVWSQF